MGFMACSRWLDQTGMYLKNEYSVFKGHPDFRPYKVSLTRILRFRVGLVGALWLSLQDYIRFVLIFFSVLCSRIGAKKYLVGFPTRHRRRFYSVFCKLVTVYLLVTIWVTANVSKKQSSSQQIRQAVFSFGDICCSAILFYGFHQELRITEILLHKIIRLHIMHPKICFTKFACFFPERLNWSYAPSAWIISISISGAVMTFTTSIFCSYALLNRNSSLRESKIRITEICSSNPFRKYYA